MAKDTLYGVHMLFQGGSPQLGNGTNTDSLKRYIDEAAKLGVDVIRFPGDWNALEPDRRQWNRSYIDETREAIQYAAELGIEVVMLFAQTPAWARPNTNDSIWHPPADVADFANAITYFYNQLLSVEENIIAWEIWNEPNVFEFWGSANPAFDKRQVDGEEAFVLIDTRFASEYVALLNAAYDSLHTAAASASNSMTVLGGSTAGTDFQYVQAMLSAGAKLDGLAVHPYTRVNDTPDHSNYGRPWAPNATLSEFNDSARPVLNQLWSFEYGLNQLRALVSQDIWITEFGWTVGNGWADVSETVRTQYMEIALQQVQAWEDVRVAIAYRLFDDGAGNFGLLNIDGSIRESGNILKEYAELSSVGIVKQGTNNADILTGTLGDDQLFGLSGDDILEGLSGHDFYLGGPGNDLFVYSSGQDFVGDFELSRDKIELTSIEISNFSETESKFQQWGPNTAIVLDREQWIVLENIDSSELSAQNFVFSNAIDLAATKFDVINDHVLTGWADINLTIQNRGGTVSEFTVDIIYSDDQIMGNQDDQIIGTQTIRDLVTGLAVNRRLRLQLPTEVLNNRALADDLPTSQAGKASSSADYIGITDATGKTLAVDDITYFPWDVDGNGEVTPSDAIYVVNRLGQSVTEDNALADFDGNGQITPSDAIASINRLGYSVNNSVFE